MQRQGQLAEHTASNTLLTEHAHWTRWLQDKFLSLSGARMLLLLLLLLLLILPCLKDLLWTQREHWQHQIHLLRTFLKPIHDPLLLAAQGFVLKSYQDLENCR